MYSSAAPPPHPRAPPACQTEPPPPLTAPLPLSGSRSLRHCSESLGSSEETLKLVLTPGADREKPRQTFFSFAPRRPRRSSGGLLTAAPPSHLFFVYTAWISPSDLHHGKHRRLPFSLFRGGGGEAARAEARDEEGGSRGGNPFPPRACTRGRARARALSLRHPRVLTGTVQSVGPHIRHPLPPGLLR